MVEEAVFDKSHIEALYRQASLEDWQEHGNDQALVYGFGEPCLVTSSDATLARRSSCRVVNGLRYGHTQSHEVGGRGIVVGHQYQLLRYVGEAHTSWTLPLMHATVWVKTIRQSRLPRHRHNVFRQHCRRMFRRFAPLTVGMAMHQCLPKRSINGAALYARMRHDRDLWYTPPPVVVKERGAPRRYGEAFDTKDATTWRMPDDDCQFSHKRYGLVHLQRWNGLLMRPPKNNATTEKHRRQAPLPLDVMRCTIHGEHDKPTTIWLVFQANALPASIAENTIAIWHTFSARSGIEASIKVSK
jgi:hypothetical protein